jgi:multidrug efflux pump subunit AcrA (membrane-fusion protein)
MATTTVSKNRSAGRRPQGFRLTIASALVPGLCLALAGCAGPLAEGPAAVPPPVTVSHPVEREVTDYADFTARTAAVDSVELRARVSGYLDRVNFKEGALVKKGDALFEIDPRTYQADLHHAEGNLASMEARLKRLDADYALPAPGGYRSRQPGRVRQGRRRPRETAASRGPGGCRGTGRWTWASPGSPRRSAAASAATTSPWAT